MANSYLGKIDEHIVYLDEDSLDDLERQLSIGLSKLEPGIVRGVEVAGEKTTIKVPEISDLKQVTNEIIDSYRRGVKIASFTESLPLVPLFQAAKQDLPPDIKVLYEQQNYDFYWVPVTFSILLPEDQFPIFAEFILEIKDDVTENSRQTRPIRLFPDRKDIDLFRIDVEGAIGVNAGLEISTMLAGNEIIPFGHASADASIKLKFIMSPISYRFRRAAVEVRGESDTFAQWRYNIKSVLSGTNEFKSILILKVPREANRVSMNGTLNVIPCKRKWGLFKDKLPALPDARDLTVELVNKRR